MNNHSTNCVCEACFKAGRPFGAGLIEAEAQKLLMSWKGESIPDLAVQAAVERLAPAEAIGYPWPERAATESYLRVALRELGAILLPAPEPDPKDLRRSA